MKSKPKAGALFEEARFKRPLDVFKIKGNERRSKRSPPRFYKHCGGDY